MCTMKMFELLQVSVGHRSALSVAPTREEWDKLFQMCYSYGLVGMGFKGIERLPKEQHPDMMQLLQWTGQAELIAQRNNTLNRQCEKVCRILKKHQLVSVILKGQSLAKKYIYPDCRKCGDIDVWANIVDSLSDSSLSERRKRVIEILKPYMTKRQMRNVVYHHMDFTSIEETQVEVHFTPSWMFNPIHNRRAQRFYQLVPVATENGVEYTLPEHFDIVFVLMHMYRHLFAEGANIRQLTDYYFVLKEYNEGCKQHEGWGQHEGFGKHESSKLHEGWGKHEGSELHEGLEKHEGCEQHEENKKPQMLLKQMGLYKFAGAVEYALQQVYAMPDEWLVVPVNEAEGKQLLKSLLTYQNTHDLDNKRFLRFMRYQSKMWRYYFVYPQEALWAIPFKLYQWIWRKINGYV